MYHFKIMVYINIIMTWLFYTSSVRNVRLVSGWRFPLQLGVMLVCLIIIYLLQVQLMYHNTFYNNNSKCLSQIIIVPVIQSSSLTTLPFWFCSLLASLFCHFHIWPTICDHSFIQVLLLWSFYSLLYIEYLSNDGKLKLKHNPIHDWGTLYILSFVFMACTMIKVYIVLLKYYYKEKTVNFKCIKQHLCNLWIPITMKISKTQ